VLSPGEESAWRAWKVNNKAALRRSRVSRLKSAQMTRHF
jgi:hypothetical protein